MTSVSLKSLLDGLIEERQLPALAAIDIDAIEIDSRLISNRGLFVALKGAQTDGRLYIDKAIEQGAVAVLVDKDDGVVTRQHSVPVIEISALNSQLSEIASRFYQFPQQQLKIIGITGTNGKTTVNQLVGQWLTLLGHRVYCMGTLGNGLYGQLSESPNTTLNAIDLIAHLHRARHLGANYVVMEVSSHGLVQDRVKSLTFDVAALTNISQDHLDFHGTMQAYSDAKQQLFTPNYSRSMVLNGDDKTAQIWMSTWLQAQRDVDLMCFNRPHGLAQRSVLVNNVHYNHQGITATLAVDGNELLIQSKLLGRFNLDNLLTALSCLLTAGFDINDLLKHCADLTPVTGRMEVFGHDKSPSVVVDYAHTPDALMQTLQALRQHCHGKLWVVFGCGGDRDSSKRPIMARIAEQYADKVILTEDNSRSESASDIFAHMLAGVNEPQAITVEPERTSAVKWAITQAAPEDIVLLAGKGHENYQILQSGRVDYDERALAQQMVENLQ